MGIARGRVPVRAVRRSLGAAGIPDRLHRHSRVIDPGDRLGRTSFETLVLCRFVTGLGIGGSGPCFVALASEYAPRRIRAGMVTIVWGAVPGGGLVAALVGRRP